MKNLTTVPLRATLLLLALFAAQTTMAYDVEIDGIFYNLKHETATVTYDSKYHTSSCSGDVVIPSSIVYNGMQYTVTTIGKYAFYFSNITSVDIPNSVTKIEDYAFSYCSSLTSIQIPNSVRFIGSDAFFHSGLSRIDIPNSVTHINFGAFDETPWYDNLPDGVVYLGPYVYKYKGKETMPENTSITIKSGTIGICEGSFSNCENLVSIDFPNTLKYVGMEAFSRTPWHDNQPDGLIYAGQVAIHYKGAVPSNTDLTIKDGTIAIGDGAFSMENYNYDCTYKPWYDGLVSVTLPNSVQYIGHLAFDGCDSLRKVIIGNSVEEIGEMAFPYNENLTDVTISEGVKVIGEQMFAGCTSLRKIIIPNSVEVIRYRAFGEFDENGYIDSEGCFSLTDVTIGSGVKSIESAAFSGCKALTKVTCLATTPPLLEDVSCFDEENYTEAILFVPKGSELDYMMAYGWKKFIHIVGIDVHTDVCDVNGDGVVNISDLNNVVNDILSGKGDPSMDVNGDGSVNISDINIIVQSILTSN